MAWISNNLISLWFIYIWLFKPQKWISYRTLYLFIYISIYLLVGMHLCMKVAACIFIKNCFAEKINIASLRWRCARLTIRCVFSLVFFLFLSLPESFPRLARSLSFFTNSPFSNFVTLFPLPSPPTSRFCFFLFRKKRRFTASYFSFIFQSFSM